MTAKIVKIIFSYDRPLQLDGLIRSILTHTDLVPKQIVCLCRSSSSAFRRAYNQVSRELQVAIIHENVTLPGLDYRQLDRALSILPRGRYRVRDAIRRLTTPAPIIHLITTAAADADFISFAVDDMVYFQHASFAYAATVMQDNPAICVWSWRLGADLQRHPNMKINEEYWTLQHQGLGIPYGYVFHTDGSLFRRAVLERWLVTLKPRTGITLNDIESKLWDTYRNHPESVDIGELHAGPSKQACITWQINKVSLGGSHHYIEDPRTKAEYLLQAYLHGASLDYSLLPEGTSWIKELNRTYMLPHTHIAPIAQAVEVWAACMTARPLETVQTNRSTIV
jgi:hypothetical protein